MNTTDRAPTITPWHRNNPPDVDSYRHLQPVWAWLHGHNRWLPGEVQVVGEHGLQVHCQLPGGGAEVDTLRPEYVMDREAA